MPLRCPKVEAKIGHHVNQIHRSTCITNLEQAYHLALADIVDLQESGRISEAERLLVIERVSIAMNTWKSRTEYMRLISLNPRQSNTRRLTPKSGIPS